MAAIKLKHNHSGFTMLPDQFIDQYMPLANGEYVKVYLYLLRQAGLTEPRVGVEDIAENLMQTERDVVRAIKYWAKQGLLSVTFSSRNEYDYIELLLPSGGAADDPAGTPAAESAASAVSSADPVSEDPIGQPGAGREDSDRPPADTRAPELSPASEPSRASESSADMNMSAAKASGLPAPERRDYTPQEIEEITQSASLEELIFVVSSYIGRPLSQTELTSIIYFYDQLGFSAELIEYLFEYCISKNHKSIRYIEKTALNWAADHISTPEEARAHTAGYTEDCFSVLRAFGISGRNPAEREIKFVKTWREEYGMPPELIREACSRTIGAIHTPSFEYADSILSGWKKAGAKTLDDIAKLDAAFAAKKQNAGSGHPAYRQGRGQSQDAGKSGARAGGGRPPQTKFSNFEERNHSAADDAELEKYLLGVPQRR